MRLVAFRKRLILVYYKGGDELCTTYWYVMMIKKS